MKHKIQIIQTISLTAVLTPLFCIGLASHGLAKEEGVSSMVVHTSSQAVQGPIPVKNDATGGALDSDSGDIVVSTMDEMNKIVQRMNQWLQRNLPESYGKKGPVVFHPDMDLSETPAEYLIKMDLPGMRKEDIQIEVIDQTVTISGERKKETEQTTQDGIQRKERNFGAFQRSMTLPDPVKAEQVTAEYLNGILTVKIPKAAPAEQKKVKVSIS